MTWATVGQVLALLAGAVVVHLVMTREGGGRRRRHELVSPAERSLRRELDVLDETKRVLLYEHAEVASTRGEASAQVAWAAVQRVELRAKLIRDSLDGYAAARLEAARHDKIRTELVD